MLQQEAPRSLQKSIRALHSLRCSGRYHRLLRRRQALRLWPPDRRYRHQPVSRRQRRKREAAAPIAEQRVQWLRVGGPSVQLIRRGS